MAVDLQLSVLDLHAEDNNVIGLCRRMCPPLVGGAYQATSGGTAAE